MTTAASAISHAPRPSSLADVLDLILDKGLVIDAYVRVSLAGIELLTVDARVVVASVDTYLRFAEAVNRLDLTATEQRGLAGLLGGNKETSAPQEQHTSSRDHRPSLQSSATGGHDGQSTEDPGVLSRIAERARR